MRYPLKRATTFGYFALILAIEGCGSESSQGGDSAVDSTAAGLTSSTAAVNTSGSNGTQSASATTGATNAAVTNTSATGMGAAGTTSSGAVTTGVAGTGGVAATLDTTTMATSATTSGSGGTGTLEPHTPLFETTVLETEFFSEGADVGDVDADGVLDLVAGPRWYKGPSFEFGGQLFDAPSFTTDQYSTFFLTFVDDVNQDGYVDVLAIGDAGGGNGSGNPNAHWYQNPGPNALDQVWAKHVLFDGLVSNESPAYVNLLGDERRELVFMTDGQLGYATPTAVATEPWMFTPVSGDDFNTPYVHGLGVGDVNGDGLLDIVEATGYWQQPPASGAEWTHHAADFDQGSRGGAQMLVYDVDGDGDADIVASLNAHGYGLSWFEQQPGSSFVHHEILAAASGGDSFSQIHALAAADLNGDGLSDVVTGKRYYAHPSTNPDPGTNEDPVLYWFELDRSDGASFIPHLIHAESGVGCNFRVIDVDGNGRQDVFVSNKHGVFLHRQQ